MSNDTQKADQIAFHFYTKLFYAVNDARATEGPRPQSKIDKWFNLETPDSDAFSKDARDRYRSISQAGAGGPPPLEIQVVLAVPELANNEVLVHVSPDSSRVRVEPTPRLIVLETWLLECTPHRPGSADHHANANANPDIALPIIYKHGIVLFRSVFSLLRILPAWKYYKRLRRRTGGRTANLGIQLRVRPIGRDEEEGRILHFGQAPSPSHSTPFSTSSHTFPPIPHILGTLCLSATYLNTPNFQLDELESLLSSRFISLDLEGFVPTLDKNRQRESITGSSLPARSPPKTIGRAPSAGTGLLAAGIDSASIAEKFILPARGTPSLGTTASTGSTALIPPPRPFPITQAPVPTQPIPARFRRESMNSSSSSSISARDNNPFPTYPTTTSLSSSPSSGPLPIRRPNINPVHPFKSNTVSSASNSSPSVSLRQGQVGSPAGGASIMSSHSRQASASNANASPIPTRLNLPPSPITGGSITSRVSPPFYPSSLGERRPGTSGSGHSSDRERFSSDRYSLDRGDRDRRVSLQSLGSAGLGSAGVVSAGLSSGGLSSGGLGDTEREGTGVPMPAPRKRYSSSFGHRYAGSGGSSVSGVPPSGSGATTAAGGGIVGSAASGGSGSTSGSGMAAAAAALATIAAGGSPLAGAGVTLPSAGSGDSPVERRVAIASANASGRNTPASFGDPQRKEGVSSYLDTNTDDDDISVFVQDIDARKPLIGRAKEQEHASGQGQQGQGHDRQYTDTTVKGTDSSRRGSILDSDSPTGTRGPFSPPTTTSNPPSPSSTNPPTGYASRGVLHSSPLSAPFRTTVTRRQSSGGGRSGNATPDDETPTGGPPVGFLSASPPTTTSTPLSTNPNPAPAVSSPLAAIPSPQPVTATAPQASTSPNRGPMLTSQGEVDERLSRMNEAFFKSLEGLGSGSNRRKEKERERQGSEGQGIREVFRRSSALSTIPSASASGSVSNANSSLATTSEDSSVSGGVPAVVRLSDPPSGVPSRMTVDPATRASRGLGLGLGFPSGSGSGNSSGSADGPSPAGRLPYAYNTPGLGLGIGRGRHGSSSSLLAGSDGNASQGSEEVIGRMDLYEERRRGYQS